MSDSAHALTTLLAEVSEREAELGRLPRGARQVALSEMIVRHKLDRDARTVLHEIAEDVLFAVRLARSSLDPQPCAVRQTCGPDGTPTPASDR